MRKQTILILTLLLSGSDCLFSQDCIIELVAEPGISVFLNGSFEGVTTVAMGGLYIEYLDAGTYRIKVVKEGYAPREESIELRKGEKRRYIVPPFAPGAPAEQEVNEDLQIIENQPLEVQLEDDLELEELLLEEIELEDHPEDLELEETEEGCEDSEVFYIVEDMPRFNLGDPATEFRKYIAANLMYPEGAAKEGISGRVIVQFTVNSFGSVVNSVVVRSVDPDLDKEAIRVVSSSPPWTPGKQRGKPVCVIFTFPINFVLQ